MPFPSEKDTQLRIDLVADAASRGQRTLVYAYERELDHVGHGQGCGSAAWADQLARIDGVLARLREALPSDVVLVVTGDHGMVDVPADRRLVIEDEPELAAGVSVVAGEARFRHLYVDVDAPASVARRWRDRLGSRAWVRTRDEAIDEGWFGPVRDEVRERYGDVVAAPTGDWAFMTRTFPQEMELVGMHASLTPVEMRVPLVVATAGPGDGVTRRRTEGAGAFAVPVVDLAPWVDRGAYDDEARARVAAELDDACRRVGFVQVLGHGVPDAAVAGLAGAMDDFFGLPLADKLALKVPANRGYSAPKSESLSLSLGVESANRMNDFFEAFNVGVEARSFAGLGLDEADYGLNVWPDVPGFRERRRGVLRRGRPGRPHAAAGLRRGAGPARRLLRPR